MEFFCQLPLQKSQADALLRQLATHWDEEFDTLCALLTHAAIVYMDETGWKVGNETCSLWAFASQLQRVFLFGCHKDDVTLDKMLPPEVFAGIGVSDDAAVYENRFKQGQKCWAHLLRKAIKLDMTFREDESRIREPHVRENFAWLNRFVLSLLKQHPGKDSIAMKRRGCGWSDDFLLEVFAGQTL